MRVEVKQHLVVVTLVWCMHDVYGSRGWYPFRADPRETRECAAHTSHRRHTHMLMHASYDVNAISAPPRGGKERKKEGLPIWIRGSLFMPLFFRPPSPSHSLCKFECGPVHPLNSQLHLNTASTNRDPLEATRAVEKLKDPSKQTSRQTDNAIGLPGFLLPL